VSGAALAAVGALLLLLLLAPVVWAVLRRPARVRIAAMRGRTVLAMLALSAVAPLVVIFAPLRVTLKIDTVPLLVLAILGALLAVVVVVGAPLATLLAGAVWLIARGRRRRVAGHPPAA
jgi:hypothetical protein